MTNIEERLSQLEHRVTAIEMTMKARPRQVVKSDSLPNKILKLRDSGFFSTPQTDIETHRKLEEMNYHCEVNRVTMALLRLQSKRKLRRATKIVNEKEKVAYVW